MAKTRVNAVHPKTGVPAVAIVINEDQYYVTVKFADDTITTVNKAYVTFF